MRDNNLTSHDVKINDILLELETGKCNITSNDPNITFGLNCINTS